MYSEYFDLFLNGENQKLSYLAGEKMDSFPVNRPLEEEYQLFFQKVLKQFPDIRLMLWENFNMPSTSYFFTYLEYQNGSKARIRNQWRYGSIYKGIIRPKRSKSRTGLITYENNLEQTLSGSDLIYDGDVLKILDTKLEPGSLLEVDATYIQEHYQSILDLLALIYQFARIGNDKDTLLNLNTENFIHTVELQSDGSFTFNSERSYDLYGELDAEDPDWDK